MATEVKEVFNNETGQFESKRTDDPMLNSGKYIDFNDKGDGGQQKANSGGIGIFGFGASLAAIAARFLWEIFVKLGIIGRILATAFFTVGTAAMVYTSFEFTYQSYPSNNVMRLIHGNMLISTILVTIFIGTMYLLYHHDTIVEMYQEDESGVNFMNAVFKASMFWWLGGIVLAIMNLAKKGSFVMMIISIFVFTFDWIFYFGATRRYAKIAAQNKNKIFSLVKLILSLAVTGGILFVGFNKATDVLEQEKQRVASFVQQFNAQFGKDIINNLGNDQALVVRNEAKMYSKQLGVEKYFLMSLKEGDILSITQKTNGRWIAVSFNGNSGFMREDVLYVKELSFMPSLLFFKVINPLMGTWVNEEGIEVIFDNINFTMQYEGQIFGEGRYTVKGNKLTMKGARTNKSTFSISGNTLTIDTNGEIQTFTKK